MGNVVHARRDVSASSSGVTDHGALTGLTDDDHTQYLLEDGSRAMSGDLDMGTNAITNVGNVDGVDVSAHAGDATIHFTEGSIDHTAIINIGTNTHAQIDTHVADSTIHFTEGSIDHTAIANIGTNTHAQLDTHVADSTIHFTEASIDHTAITNIGTNTHAQLDTHVATSNIHFTEASIDHTAITNIGSNSHAAIDTHIADDEIHFTYAQNSQPSNPSTDGVTWLRTGSGAAEIYSWDNTNGFWISFGDWCWMISSAASDVSASPSIAQFVLAKMVQITMNDTGKSIRSPFNLQMYRLAMNAQDVPLSSDGIDIKVNAATTTVYWDGTNNYIVQDINATADVNNRIRFQWRFDSTKPAATQRLSAQIYVRRRIPAL